MTEIKLGQVDGNGSEIITDGSGNKADLSESGDKITLETREQVLAESTKAPEIKRTIVYYHLQLFWRDEKGEEIYGQQPLIQVEGKKYHISSNYMSKPLSGEVSGASTSEEVYQVAWEVLCEYFAKTRTPISSGIFSKDEGTF
ncbi:MAG: hypothetical protein UR28_C0016G0011 [Candidatus Peregrinibacteria bacterium GW2011_GWF2_33_10]|nr:MAG: hypothetical protein UR28_C0016G0011 [Candidatus Peregrinibacteria bacterium GW2011_GWF2_33_10]OGJ45841.1 MAG: hypothetical protein A2263_03555 [Candidatus Peregrinibacteria bacterium RIFOXYA2_FULL_33_21]OGJ46491.1 MAG: hypothetical protein A2272_03565 [Candidatus Peregrinibacteria bacterium RIFOXYA12_FULL_33_12]OGJ51368.1 MAG: hypothetical protein A2307_02345 [Candidatus Peregrinibacteria bacterium RIFOXYB2_FULL_33_20]